MTAKRIGSLFLTSLALTVLIFAIEVNIFSDDNLNKNEINIVLFWSFIKALVISLAVNIGNQVSSLNRNK